MKIQSKYVQYMPKELEPGILYIAKEFGAVAHLCPCGCGSKIRTPLGPTEWSLKESKNGPTLYPSIGNWQRPCRSHYWIRNGEIEWSYQWSEEEVLEGRVAEEKRRQEHYEQKYVVKKSILKRVWDYVKNLLRL